MKSNLKYIIFLFTIVHADKYTNSTNNINSTNIYCKQESNNYNNIIYITNSVGMSVKYGSGKNSYSMVNNLFSRTLYNTILSCDNNNTFTKKFNYKNNDLDDYDYYEKSYYGNIIIGYGIHKNNTENNNFIVNNYRSIGKPSSSDFILYVNDEEFVNYIINTNKCNIKKLQQFRNTTQYDTEYDTEYDYLFKSICLFVVLYYYLYYYIFIKN